MTNIRLRAIMDERERVELNKQKKLVDCIEHLNSVLQAFDRLEDYKARVLPIIDGFDLTHSDTYFELTENIKRELFYIKFFSEHAASKLVKYRRLCNPESDIYSIKEKKNQEKYGLKPLGDWRKQSEETQRILNDSQKKIEEMLSKGEKENTDEVHTSDYAQLLAEYQPKVIKTKAENDRAIASATELEHKANRTPGEDTILELLVTLIEKFEDEQYPIPQGTPHSMLLHLMDAGGIKQENLVGVIGSTGVVSEVVNGKRSISKAQAKALAEFFSVDVGLFI